jgi:3-hydroxyisobutyrate dehydrogenase-like beta-hydroxyacid dehydrogenase
VTVKHKVGFIGVGLMGHGMAKNILEKGHPLWVLGHRNRGPVEDLVKRGAEEAGSPAEMARACDVVFLCVTGSQQVEALVRGADGIKKGAHEGLIVIDCSTSEPTSTEALAAELKPLGVRLIDVPLGRTPREAAAGRLVAFVGADEATLAEVRPVIDCWAETVIHVGPVTHGHKIKLINNFIAMSKATVFAEAYTTAKKTGVDIEKLHAVLSSGLLNSGFYQNMAKWVIGGDPEAHLFTLRNCRKDIGYYNNLADAAGVTSIVAGAVKQAYTIALAQGKQTQNLPQMIDAVAELNGVKLR